MKMCEELPEETPVHVTFVTALGKNFSASQSSSVAERLRVLLSLDRPLVSWQVSQVWVTGYFRITRGCLRLVL